MNETENAMRKKKLDKFVIVAVYGFWCIRMKIVILIESERASASRPALSVEHFW